MSASPLYPRQSSELITDAKSNLLQIIPYNVAFEQFGPISV
jgi:hypothetical protein